MKRLLAIIAAAFLSMSALAHADSESVETVDFTVKMSTPDAPAVTPIPSDKVVVLFMAYPVQEDEVTGEMHKPGGLCSGFFIGSKNQIMTAAHCVSDPELESVMVKTSDNKQYPAKVLYVSDTSDLALLKISTDVVHPYFEVADTVAQGDEVYALGHPLRNEYVLTRGIVAQLEEPKQKKTLVDLTILPGNSGCPVYNKDGKLIGVASAGYIVFFGTTGLNLVASLDQIHEFLDLFKGL